MANLLKVGAGLEVVTPANNVAFTLEELQGYVGGYIEIVHLSNGCALIINEEGKLQELPYNSVATGLFEYSQSQMGYAVNDYIVGPALFVDKVELDDMESYYESDEEENEDE